MESRVETALRMCYESQHVEGLEKVLAHARDSGWTTDPAYAPLIFGLGNKVAGDPPSDYNELFVQSLLGQVELDTAQAREIVERSRKAENRGAARQAIGRLQRDHADSVLLDLMYEQSRDFIRYVVSCFSFALEDYLAEFRAGECRVAAYLVPELLDCFPDVEEARLADLYDDAAEGTVKELLGFRLGVQPGAHIAYPPVNKFFMQLPNPRAALEVELHKAEDPDRAVREYAVAPFHLRCLMLGRYLLAAEMALLQKEDAFLTSRLGPVNTLYDACFEIPEPTLRGRGVEFANECDKCAAYGGCRLFICTCFEGDALDDEEEADAPSGWFTGACELCGDEIAQQYDAHRVPLSHGGWKGCFCSEECMQLDKPGAALLATIEANARSLLSDEQ